MRFPKLHSCGGACSRALLCALACSRALLCALALSWLGRAHAQAGLDAGIDAAVFEHAADAGDADVPLAPEAAPAGPPALDVLVRSKPHEALRLQRSAEAVSVIDLTVARVRNADLGEVLARTQGIGVRREGGLGSRATVQMNGLEGDQVRTFLDGVPLELAGYPFGIANVPVNALERVDIYRGVVPIRYGADALGGAIDLVSDTRLDTHAAASYQLGSFGTHRATVNGRHVGRQGLLAGANAFIDASRNDFIMHDRALPTPDGGSIVRDVKRFHDAYRAYGANVQLGVLDKRWARKLVLSGFLSSYDKELQHNPVMTIPYGRINYGELSGGATVRYEVDLTEALSLRVLASYTRRRVDFQDVSPFKYGWDGKQGMSVGRGPLARGELNGTPTDESLFEDAVYTRALVSYRVMAGHELRVAITPHFATRIPESNLTDRVVPPGLRNDVFRLVSGIEYELNAFSDRLQNIVFGKDYFFSAHTQVRAQVSNALDKRDYSNHRLGLGDMLRYRFTDWLYAKLSYEYATRLPNADELFGDGVLVSSNVSLKPEVSHNANLGPRLELKRTRLGDFVFDANAFLRDTRDMIVRIVGTSRTPYQNVGNARGLGVESALAWTAPGKWLNLNGAVTYQDVRNTSTRGPFAPYEGQRIPSRPYLFASWGGGVRIPGLPGENDALVPYYAGRYVHGYKRGWDVGDPLYWLQLPSMVSHDLGLSYQLGLRDYQLGATFTVSNLTNERLYDTFGVERAGRAYYFKLSGEY